MKIQLDTDQKTIKIESDVTLQKLVETLESMLPGGKWKEFTLKTNVTVNWGSNSIIHHFEHHHDHWAQPVPWVTYVGKNNAINVNALDGSKAMSINDATYALNPGVYNIKA